MSNYSTPYHPQNAFFDRMSTTDTFASKDMKGKVDRTPKKVDDGKRTTVSNLDIFIPSKASHRFLIFISTICMCDNTQECTF